MIHEVNNVGKLNFHDSPSRPLAASEKIRHNDGSKRCAGGIGKMPRLTSKKRLAAKIKKLIADGWGYEGSFYVFKKEEAAHYYEIRFRRDGEKKIIASGSPSPFSFDADWRLIKENE
jgi:hypothetical protein